MCVKSEAANSAGRWTDRKDLPWLDLGGSPRFDLPLQGAELDVGKSAWEATLKVLEEGLGLEPGIEFQQVTKLGPRRPGTDPPGSARFSVVSDSLGRR